MNLFKKNLLNAYKAYKKKYPTLNKTKFSRMIGCSRIFFYRYVTKNESLNSLQSTKVETIAIYLERELKIPINPEDLLHKDLKNTFIDAIKDQEKQMITDAEEYELNAKGLGIFLKKERLKKDLSMKDIARRSRELYPKDKRRQISDVHILMIERGRYEAPSIPKLSTMAEIMHIPIEKILEMSGGLKKQLRISDQELNIQLNPEYLEKYDGKIEELEERIKQILVLSIPGLIP